MTTAAEIRNSLRQFEDYSNDLLGSDMSTFENHIDILMAFCETDPAFRVFHEQLASVPDVDFDSWYNELSKSGGSMVGSQKLRFPTDIEKRMAIMYELMRRVRKDEISYLTFAVRTFALGTSKIDPHVRAFNDAICKPLLRELRYRLDVVVAGIPTEPTATVPLASTQIIHNAQYVIQQSAQGDNITQNATQTLTPELEGLFSRLEEVVAKASIDNPKERADALEVVESAKEMSAQPNPRVGVIRALLGTLSHVGNTASIVSLIVAALGGS